MLKVWHNVQFSISSPDPNLRNAYVFIYFRSTREAWMNIRHYLIKQPLILGIWTVSLANRRGMTHDSSVSDTYKLIKGPHEPETTVSHSWDVSYMVWRISWPFKLIYPRGQVSIWACLDRMEEETPGMSLQKVSAMAILVSMVTATSLFRIMD